MMDVTVTRKQLTDGLKLVTGVAPSQKTLPVLSHVLVEAVDAGLQLTATDLDVWAQTTVPADTTTPGAVLVPVATLVPLVTKMPSAGIQLTEITRGRVRVLCARTDVELASIDRDEFPCEPKVVFNDAPRIVAGDLQRLVKYVAFAASREPSRPTINGILLTLDADGLCMVATNGARMSVARVSSRHDVGNWIVPRKAMEHLGALFGATDEVVFGHHDEWFGVQSDRTMLCARTIHGPYVKYQQVIPSNGQLDKSATVDRAALLAAVERVRVVTDAVNRIQLTFADDAIELDVNTSDLGHGRDRVDCAYSDPPVSASFNAVYVIDVLKSQPTSQVQIRLGGPVQPTCWDPVGLEDGTTYRHVLVPLREK